ncbi:MAG: hypothetical protein M3460_13345 [Actinomycetota bacterium]|nr:hypothetical protein [Actinomycetota bacterium]
MLLSNERKYARLFAVADRGELALPSSVVEARVVVHRLEKALDSLPVVVAPQVPRDAAVQAALASVEPEMVDVQPVLDLDRQRAEVDQRREVLQRAWSIADARLASVLGATRDEVIVDFVRPAGRRLWSEVRKAVAVLGDLDTSCVDVMLGAPDKVRRAYMEMDSLAARYVRLRSAWSPLPGGQDVEHDSDGDHAEFEQGLCRVIGPGWRGQAMAPHRPKPPWPDDQRGRLIWLVRHGHEPWWPTPAERDQAWLEAHRKQYERMQTQQRRHRIAQAWGHPA